VWGDLKDPQKAGSRWEKRAKTGWTGWTGFHQEDLGSLIYSAGDSTGSKIGWVGKNFGWTGFTKISATIFLTALTFRQSKQGWQRNSPETGWIGFRSGWTGFRGWRASFEHFEVNKGGTLVGRENGFSQRHSWSGKVFSKMILKDFELSSLHNLLNHRGSLLIERRFL
jgi:hypothetical protein